MKDLTKQAIECLKQYLDIPYPSQEQTAKAHVALTILMENKFSERSE